MPLQRLTIQELLYTNSKIKRSLDSLGNQFKTMLLAAQDILKQSDDSKEIKDIENQVEKIKQNLEVAFQSKNASFPNESFADFLAIYELYIKAQSTSDIKERFEALQELPCLLKEFRSKYKDFILGEADKIFSQFETWAEISFSLMKSKLLILNESLEEDEVRQLTSFYSGIIQYLETLEAYLSFFTEQGRTIAKNVAKQIIDHKPFKSLVNKRFQDDDEKTNVAIAIINTAKAILWEIDSYEKKVSGEFFHVQVTELVRGLKFAFPVTIKIERIEESLFVAECPILNISIPAENYEDALNEIKEVLVDDYKIFLGNYPQKLTKEALNTLRLYCALFGEDLPK